MCRLPGLIKERWDGQQVGELSLHIKVFGSGFGLVLIVAGR